MAIRIVRLGTLAFLKKACALVPCAGRRARAPKLNIRQRDYSTCGCRSWRERALVSLRLSEHSRRSAGPLRTAIPARNAKTASRRLIALLVRCRRGPNFSVGCYCEDESRCHRSLFKATFN